MNCLVVIAHPLENSLCQSLGRFVAARLGQGGHEVVVEDLYAQRFDANLTEAERSSYYSGYDASAVSEQAERLLRAEVVVLVFPTWWFGFPAILKGWFDRVWGPKIAYDHSNNFGPIQPRLELKQVLAITTLGAPRWVDYLVLWRPVKRILRLAILGGCAKSCRLDFLSLYQSEDVSTVRFQRFTQRIDRVIAAWP